MADDQKPTTEKYPVLYRDDLDAELKDLETQLKSIEASINSGERDLKQETTELAKLESDEIKLSQKIEAKNKLIKGLDETKLDDKKRLEDFKNELEKLNEQLETLKETIAKLNPNETQGKLDELTNNKNESKERISEVNHILRNSEVLRPSAGKLKFGENRLLEEYKSLENSDPTKGKAERQEMYEGVKNDSLATKDNNLLSEMFSTDKYEAEQQHIEKLAEEKGKKVEEEAKKEMERRAEESKKAVEDIMNGKKVGGGEVKSPIGNIQTKESAPILDTKRFRDFVSKLFDNINKKTENIGTSNQRKWAKALLFTAILAVGSALYFNKDKKNTSNVPTPPQATTPTSKKTEEVKPPTGQTRNDTPIETQTEQKKTLVYGDENRLLGLTVEKLQNKNEGYLLKFENEIKNLTNDSEVKNFVGKYLETKGHSKLDDYGYNLLSGDLSKENRNDIIKYKGNVVFGKDSNPLTKWKAFSVYNLIRDDVHIPIKIREHEAIDSSELWDLLENMYCLVIKNKMDPVKFSDKYLEGENLIGFLKKLHHELIEHSTETQKKLNEIKHNTYTGTDKTKEEFIDEKGNYYRVNSQGIREYFTNEEKSSGRERDF